MKKMFLYSLTLLSFGAHADELSSFNDIVKAVAHGKKITFVVEVNSCSKAPLVLKNTPMFSLTPNAIMVVGDDRVTASDRHFSLDDPSAHGNPSFGYSKFNITADGKATIKITTMNAINYEKLSSYQINCELGEGFKVFD